MAENALTGGSVASPAYPTFQPVQQINPLAQVQAAQGLALQQQALQSNQLGMQHKKLEILHNEMGALTSIPGGPSWQDVQDRVTSLTQMGILKPEEAASALPNIPQGSGPDANMARKAFFDKQLQITGGYAGNMAAAYGAGGSVDQGNVIQPTVRDIRSQAVMPAPGPNYGMGTSPAQRIAPHQTLGPDGSVINTTVGQSAAASGMNPVTGTPLAGAFKQPGQPQGYAGPGPTLAADTQALNTDRDAAAATIKGVQAYANAIPLLEDMKATDTGPGTAWQTKAKAFLISQGWKLPDNATDMRQEVDKYLQQAVAGTPLAGRSDLGLSATRLSSPNTDVQTRQATINLAKQALAQARASAATPAAWESDNPTGYLAHKSTFPQSQDFRAYQLDLMKPQERQSLLDQNKQWLQSGSAEQKSAAQRFFKSLTAADRAKVLNIAP